MEQQQSTTQISEVKGEMLQKKHEEKESWFAKKEALKKDIQEAIKQIKEVKRQWDASKIQQRQAKAERDASNQKARELIAQIKPLQEETKKTKEQHPRWQIEKIQRFIERLETKIETEVMPFEKEKELMTKIKKLKKQLDENLVTLEGRQQYYHLSKEIRDIKKKADDFHKQFLEERTKEKETMDQFIMLTKKINELRKQQEEAYQTFIALKQEYQQLASQRKEQQYQRKTTQERKKQFRVLHEQQRHEQEKKLILEKSRQVEAKLKTKKKLTTEDLIAFQGAEEN